VAPYELIIADHVFYGEPMEPALVERLLAMLLPNGVAIVTLETRTCDLFSMRMEAGISTNSAEDFESLLGGNNKIAIEVFDYDSRLYYDPQVSAYQDWFFATARVSDVVKQRLLDTFSRADEDGRTYINNHARVFLIRGRKESA
jgi:hypothetical protein